MSLCMPEKYMFLWFSFKEVFLITKQDGLNSLFYEVGNFYFDFSDLLNTMVNAMEEQFHIWANVFCLWNCEKFFS